MAFKFKHSLTVRFRDIDMLGHVNNAVYFTYLEEARTTFFKTLGYGVTNFRKECPIILARAECDYKSPSFFNETLDIHLGITEIKNASFTIAYDLSEQSSNRTVARASTVLVTYDYSLNKVIPIPKKLREDLEKFKSTGGS